LKKLGPIGLNEQKNLLHQVNSRNSNLPDKENINPIHRLNNLNRKLVVDEKSVPSKPPFRFGPSSGRYSVGRVPLRADSESASTLENSKPDGLVLPPSSRSDNPEKSHQCVSFSDSKNVQSPPLKKKNSQGSAKPRPRSINLSSPFDAAPNKLLPNSRKSNPSLNSSSSSQLPKLRPRSGNINVPVLTVASNYSLLIDTPPNQVTESASSLSSGYSSTKSTTPSCSAGEFSSSVSPVVQHHSQFNINWTEDIIYVNSVPYWKLNLLGRGGTSRVFRVLSPDRSIYAIKQVDKEGVDSVNLDQFTEEVKLLEKLNSFNCIISLIDKEVTPKFINIVLECGEIDLATILSRHKEGLLNQMNYLRLYWQQILEAVSVIHKERIVHGDLKPQNFVMVKGSLKLIDFGIAKAIRGNTTNIERENISGTLNYLAPETLTATTNGISKCGRPADIWSLGCILYQMVYGKAPLAKEGIVSSFNIIAWLTSSQKVSIPQPIPSSLAIVISLCLDRDPKNRPTVSNLLLQPF